MSATRLLFIHALSPLHAGTGQGVGVIDLPIARETATGLPYLPGSSIKGTLRDSAAISEDDKQVIFGPITEYASDNAGSVQFADARLLLLPVRSLAGTFAWVTSPYVLRRFIRDARAAAHDDLTPIADWRAPEGDAPERCKITSTSVLQLTADTVVLEDLDLRADIDPETTAFAQALSARLFPDGSDDAAFWRAAVSERLCVVRDDVLNFLLTTATEIIARVRLLDDSKTVAQGALWYEEALAAETVLTGLVVATPISQPKVRDRQSGSEKPHAGGMSSETIFATLGRATTPALQFGGKASVGRGLCRAVLTR